MAVVKNFHEKLERDLERLTAEVARRKETAKEAPPREIVKQSLMVFAPVPADPLPPPHAPEEHASLSRLPAYLERESPEVKKEVETLVARAFEHGIEAALREAMKRSPFLFDALHDALVDKLLPELEKRGIIK